MTTRKSTNL